MDNARDSARAAVLLAWYDRHRRALPWRAPAGMRPDPYHVWLSEIMLQQTTVAAVAGYFRTFLERWPAIGDLAAAPLDDVLREWAGLGYYARARNLHKCARIVVESHGGHFPQDEEEIAAASRHRDLHRRRDCRNRLRPSGGGDGWQCRARRGPSVRRDRAASTGQAQAIVADRHPGRRPADRAISPRR